MVVRIEGIRGVKERLIFLVWQQVIRRPRTTPDVEVLQDNQSGRP